MLKTFNQKVRSHIFSIFVKPNILYTKNMNIELPETKEGQRITVNVVRTDPDSHQFIVSYGEDGKLFRLPMLLYQKRSTVPDTLPCIVEESFNGGIHIRQDYEIFPSFITNRALSVTYSTGANEESIVSDT